MNLEISHLPRSFWAQPRNRDHLQKQIELLLRDPPPVTPPTPKSMTDRQNSRVESASKRVKEMATIYLSNKEELVREESRDSNRLNIVDIDPMEFDNEARELYEWSQYL